MKTKYIPPIKKFLNILDGEIEDKSFENNFLQAVLPKWSIYKEEVYWLINHFEERMSPKILLTLNPLSHLNIENKNCLQELIHFVWATKYSIKDLTESVQKEAERASNSFESLKEDLININMMYTSSLKQKLLNFYLACIDLSKSIEKFPGDILLV